MVLPEIRKIKQADDLPAVVLIAGSEEFLIEQTMHRLIEIGVPEDMRAFNLNVFYAPDATAKHVLEIARAYPMMADKRVVVVKDIQKMPAGDLKALAEYVKSPSVSTCLVFIARGKESRQKAYTDIKSRSRYIQCKPLYENKVVDWIIRELKERGYRIEPGAANLLAMQVGTGLQNLHNEIEKLLLYLGDKKEISSADVAHIAGFRKEYSIFALQNALGEKRLKSALHIYRNLRTTTVPQVILSQLARFFNNLLIAKGFEPGRGQDGELAKATGTSPYFVKDLHRFKGNYSIQELENALENLPTF